MKPFTRTASVVFAVVCAAHAVRLALHCVVTLDGYTVPMWVSVLGTITPGVLAIMLWRESRAG